MRILLLSHQCSGDKFFRCLGHPSNATRTQKLNDLLLPNPKPSSQNTNLSMKTQKQSVLQRSFFYAALFALLTQAAHTEIIDVPAGTNTTLRAGKDASSYTLHGDWAEPPDGGPAKLITEGTDHTTVSGPITVNFFDFIQAANGSDLTIQGGISGAAATSYLTLVPSEGSTITLEGSPVVLPTSLDGLVLFGDPTNQGTVVLNVSGNTWGGAIVQEGGTLRTDVANALPADGTLMVHGNLDLNGKDQAIGTLADDLPGGGVPENTSGNITSKTAATLTIEQKNLQGRDDSSGNRVESKGNFSGSITGEVSLVKLGDAVLTLGGDIDINGTTTVKEGALAVNGQLKTARLTVAQGAELKIKMSIASPSIITNAVVVAGSDLDITSSSAQPAATADPVFLVVNNSRGVALATFKSVSLNGEPLKDLNNFVVDGQKFRLVYNANFNGPGSDRLANDIALVPVR